MDNSTSRRSARRTGLRALVLVCFVLTAALMRLLPHPPNFAPIGALALFGGAHFASRVAAFGVPLAAMLVSDLLLRQIHGWGLGLMTTVVYGCFALTSWLGLRLVGKLSIAGVAWRSVASATIFFVATNFAVWATSGLYPRDAAGILACYAAALPFYGNALAGYAVYGAALFGGFALLTRRFALLERVAAAT